MSRTVKLFVLGQPGCGKSTVIRNIRQISDNCGLKSTHINDYAILSQMFHDDTEGRFRPAGQTGFDVLDFAVIDIALKRLEQAAIDIKSYQPEQLILIEFARNNYRKALRLFHRTFLRDAYFLYLQTEFEECKRRISNRIAHPTCDDDTYISSYILDTYYSQIDEECLTDILIANYSIDEQRIKGINNNSTLAEALSIIYPFLVTVIDYEFGDKYTLARSEDDTLHRLLPLY